VTGKAVKATVPRPIGTVAFACPRCERPNRQSFPAERIACTACGWSRASGRDDVAEARPQRCLVCGCEDLWRQKDFPVRLGVTIVVVGIVLSTLANWLWQPTLALGILMAFALVDFLLFTFMRDVLVCYRCGSRHGGFATASQGAAFDLEVAERYRQERLRLNSAARAPS
jgi:hypothetical protein